MITTNKIQTKTAQRKEKRNEKILTEFQAMYDEANPGHMLSAVIERIADNNGVSYSTAYNLISQYRKTLIT